MKKLVTGVMTTIMSLTIAGNVFAAPNTDNSSEVNKQLAQVRQATEKYHDVNIALKDGYINTGEIASSPEGVMGIHFINPNLMFDNGVLNQNQPEVLLYMPLENGEYKLVGVEYYVPAFMAKEHPSLFGHKFDGSMLNHDLDPSKLSEAEKNNPMNRHYDLHVWLWHANPTGIFSPWNPGINIK
ncbi:hypothetical protein [Gottfriedia acidiceleris]|uniref:hypothetical protein n=1 Tax=Gottfriedia acidiceleris TaxID=371036 RepID=UPI00101DB3C7|nr:hypothetical protein [Gottfriedia acidiceleris]